MSSVGQGVQEIRVRDATGAFRVVYVAKLVHAAKTSKADLDLAARRFRELMKEQKL